MVWIWVWGGLAMASPPTPDSPAIKRQVRRPYPRPLMVDWSQAHRCALDVTLNAQGKPTAWVPTDCPEVLVDWTVRRVRRDRWQPPVTEGAVVQVVVDYPAPVDTVEIEEPVTWRRRWRGSCHLHLKVAADGQVLLGRPEEARSDCLPAALTRWEPTPERLLQGRTPAVCEVTFQAVQGQAHHVDLFRCGLHTWDHVRAGLEAMAWPVAPTPTPYTVLLQFDAVRP